MLDARGLDYVAAVVEHGSFSRAAEALHVTQPTLSEAIKRLELQLGGRLFERTSRRVTPTAAGALLARDGRPVLDAIERLEGDVRDLLSGRSGTLQIGYVATGAGTLQSAARAAFVARHPTVTVRVRRFDWGGEVDALRAGEVDVAFAWTSGADLGGLEVLPLTVEPRALCVAAGHRLARRTEVRVDEVDPEPIVWTERAPRAWVRWWAVDPRPDGRAPRYGPCCDNVEELLDHVAAGAAYAIVPATFMTFHARPDVAFVGLAGVEPLSIGLAWRRGTGDAEPIRAFRLGVEELAISAR